MVFNENVSKGYVACSEKHQTLLHTNSDTVLPVSMELFHFFEEKVEVTR